MDFILGSFVYFKCVYKSEIYWRLHSSKSKPQNPIEIPEDSIEVQSKKRAWCEELSGDVSKGIDLDPWNSLH